MYLNFPVESKMLFPLLKNDFFSFVVLDVVVIIRIYIFFSSLERQAVLERQGRLL